MFGSLMGLSPYSGGRQGPQVTGGMVDGFSSAKESSAVLASVGGMGWTSIGLLIMICLNPCSSRPYRFDEFVFIAIMHLLRGRCRLLMPITKYPSHPDQRIAFVVLSVPPIIEDSGAMRILADGFSVR